MPWSQGPVEERSRFVNEAQHGPFTMRELCELFGVSRKTGYKWLERYAAGGLAGLQDVSRAPRHHPNQTAAEIVDRVLAARRKYPDWGPRTLRAWLEGQDPGVRWPAASTIGTLLERAGLRARRRKPRRPGPAWQTPRTRAERPNQVWSADYKGEFRLGEGTLCYPLTLMDAHSRYLLMCRGLSALSGRSTRREFEMAFREFGLPEVIRTDNGPPFGSSGLLRLSALSVWWVKLGIRLERSRPAHPEDNGAHERMHRTLKAATTRPPAQTATAQQQKFDAFLQIYNEERPHQALDFQAPARRYTASPRGYPDPVPEPQYPTHFEVRRIRKGQLKWRSRMCYVSKALSGELVGLEPVDDGIWSVYLGPVLLGRFNEREGVCSVVAGA